MSADTELSDPVELPPMPEAVQTNPILRKCVWRRFEQNKNFVGGVVGETGSGKSWGALRIAEAIDPNFSIEQVAFRIEDFLELVNDDQYGSGSMLIFDEAAVEASHQRWYDDANYLFQTVLQTWRHQNRGALFTMPELNKLSAPARARLQAYIEMKEIDHKQGVSRAKYQRIQTNPKTGKNYFKYPRLRWKGVKKKYTAIQLSPPSKDLRDAYEEKKESFTDELNASARNELADSADGDAPSAQEIADEIISDDRVGDFTAVHQGNKMEYISKEMIRAEYDLSHSDAKAVKQFVEARSDD